MFAMVKKQHKGGGGVGKGGRKGGGGVNMVLM